MWSIKSTLLILFVLLISNCKTMYGQDTVILGKANNAKYGAVVVSSDNEVYYIDQLESWTPEFIDKTVKVTGTLVIKKIKKGTDVRSGITASKIRIIKRHKVEIISK